MGIGIIRRVWSYPWVQQIAFAVGFVVAYCAVRPFSDAHWALTSGLRLSLLLLVPYRYWIALAIGDAAMNLSTAIQCEPQYGLAWSAIVSVGLMLFAMPIVWACTEKLALFPTKRLINFQTLILCCLGCSAVWALVNFGALAAIPKRGFDLNLLRLGSFFIGTYVAVLTIVPWVVMAKLGYRAGTITSGLRSFIKSPLFFDASLFLVPALLILSWLTYRATDGNKVVWALFMFAPVSWLTLKHGWRATVIGGTVTVASICLLFTWSNDSPDSEVVQVQAIIAFSVTCLLALGARITMMNTADEHEKANARQALRLARQSVLVSEIRLRQASETLEQVCGEMQLNHTRLMNRFRLMLPVNDSQTYTKQAASAQERVYRIAEAMHPVAWRSRGLNAALKENIGRALDEIGVAYNCQLTGRGLSLVSTNLHTMIYRIACEAVVYSCNNLRCSRMRLLLRGGQIDGHRIVVLRVEAIIEDDIVNDGFMFDGKQNRLATRLGATGLDLHALRDNARLFNGELHVKTTENQMRITALLVDASEKEREYMAPSPLRLWAG